MPALNSEMENMSFHFFIYYHYKFENDNLHVQPLPNIPAWQIIEKVTPSAD